MNSFANQILFGTLESVEASIQAGADIEEIDEYGFTPLIEAAIANKPDVAALLLEYGADIQQTDATGRSALHWAVDNCNLPLCELLLANKANPNAVTMAGQPVLVYPLLRRQTELKQLLYRFGAKLSFAQDFILAKLIGHRYELSGTVDIVNPQGRFIEVDYEGFFLEFTLDVIIDSLRRYKNHFSARSLRAQFNQFTQIIDAFTTAQALLQYQRYTINIEHYRHTIDALLEQQTLLLLPVAYEGHAISFIKYKSWLIRCDRGENSQREGTVVIYRINYLDRWNAEFIKKIIYQRQTREFITKTIHHVLGLTVIGHLPIPPQTQGNCSWANLEASIPAMRFILHFKPSERDHFSEPHLEQALQFYQAWRDWDRARAFEECLHGFYEGESARQVFKATLLAALLFQNAIYYRQHLAEAEKVFKILIQPDYRFLIESYLSVYWQRNPTQAGKNFVELMELCGVALYKQ